MDINLIRQHAYAPYSGSREIALAESGSGAIYPGVRIENISFPLTIPAVQSALYTCISEGEKPKKLYVQDPGDPKLSYWQNEYNVELHKLPKSWNNDLREATNSGEIEPFLKKLLEQAITMHSGFPVSAVLETDRGLISGVNIEGSAWESGLCAERVAIAKAVSYGIEGIKALHLHTQYGEYSSPCGACRQVIIEHIPRQHVIIHHADGTTSRHFSSDLLPYSFKSDFLKNRSHP